MFIMLSEKVSDHDMYKLRFFFDAGSGTCLWSADETTREKYGYPIKPEALPVKENTWRKLYFVCAWYDTSVDWDYPSALLLGNLTSAVVSTVTSIASFTICKASWVRTTKLLMNSSRWKSINRLTTTILPHSTSSPLHHGEQQTSPNPHGL